MAKQTTEEELNLKRQTRRRLIGAAALVVVIVILLPVVFDSEPAPSSGNDIELRIPKKDNAGEFLPHANLPESAVSVASAAVAVLVAASAPLAVSAPVAALPVVVTKPAVTKPAAPAPVAAKPNPVVKVPQEVKSKVENKAVAKVPAIPKSGWVLQAGAFSNVDTAKQLQAKLTKLGYHTYTEKVGNVVRVRMGSYPTREAAEKVRNKLQAQGTQCNVLSLD